jgi:hypothetical protein
MSEAMADEKQIAVASSESQLSGSDGEVQEITWTEAEEKALVRRYAVGTKLKGACWRC